LRGSRKSTLVNEMGAKSTIFQALSHAHAGASAAVGMPVGGRLGAGIGWDAVGVLAGVLG
jgi:hypothetical protein